jgi:hypothetical protein
MNPPKDFKLAAKIAAEQKELILELQSIVKDIERCEKTVNDLHADLQQVNVRHANRETTQDDINYLEDLLACARRKLVWEKHIASLQKRTPALMKRVEELVNHPLSEPDEQTQKSMLQSVQNVQAALQRLHSTKI